MKKTLIIIVLAFSISCNNFSKKEESSKYEIINMFLKKFAKPVDIFFPPPFPGKKFTSKDSARILTMMADSKKELRNKKFVIAVDTINGIAVFNGIGTLNLETKCDGYNNLVTKLVTKKIKSSLDLNKIKSSRNDSIIPYTKELLTKGTKEFVKFDYLIAFSPIAFNETYTKSIILVSRSRSRLAGTSDLYMLEKKNGKWEIKCKINLEIS